MSVHTSQVTVSTSQTLLVPSTLRRLSYVVSVPSTSSTIYITNNSGTTSGTGTPIVANGTFRMNWFDDGTQNTNRPLKALTSSGNSDVRVIETLADTPEDYIRITRGIRA